MTVVTPRPTYRLEDLLARIERAKSEMGRGPSSTPWVWAERPLYPEDLPLSWLLLEGCPDYERDMDHAAARLWMDLREATKDEKERDDGP